MFRLLALLMASPGLEAEEADFHCNIRRNGTLTCSGIEGGRVPKGRFRRVWLSTRHACALRSKGQVVCWSPREQEALPSLPPGTWRDVVVGEQLVCALSRQGALSCVGKLDWSWTPSHFVSPGFERIFHKAAADWSPPASWQAPRLDAGPFTAVSLVADTVCALRAEGLLRCFGYFNPPPGEFRALAGECAVSAEGGTLCFDRGHWVEKVANPAGDPHR